VSTDAEERKLAAIMFTDMVGYSALSQKNEGLALDLLDEHRRLLRGVFVRHGGREIEAVGDGFFVEFPSALAGANCAVEIQRTLHERNGSAPLERRIEVRIGLHLGDVVAQDDRVHGDGVNIAARIEPLAEPGGICLSEDVARQIQNKIELPLRRLGKADLKNIRTPVQIYRLALPWEGKHLPGSEQLAFSVGQRQMRRRLIGAGGLLVAGGLAGTWVWKRAQTSAGLTNNRIGVLPFVSMSASPDDEYFADGITEELISRLSRVKGLEVIARTSISSYKGTKKKIGDIAGELNVGTVLEGSVRKAEQKVRITAQLINAANEARVRWRKGAATFHRSRRTFPTTSRPSSAGKSKPIWRVTLPKFERIVVAKHRSPESSQLNVPGRLWTRAMLALLMNFSRWWFGTLYGAPAAKFQGLDTFR
jgi:class 3 adenylate cyclase/TolB-like protein